MKYVLLAAALALAGCATTPSTASSDPGAAAISAEDQDPNNLQIEIGRWGYMLSQVEDMPASEAAYPEATDRRALARNLREIVWTYNLQRSQRCASGRLPEASCGSAYTPAWLAEPADTEPSFAEISARSTAVGDVVMGFWDAFCADARAKIADEEERRAICPME